MAQEGEPSRKRTREAEPESLKGDEISNFPFIGDFNFDAFIGDDANDTSNNPEFLPSTSADMMFSFSDVVNDMTFDDETSPVHNAGPPNVQPVDTRRTSNGTNERQPSVSSSMSKDSLPNPIEVEAKVVHKPSTSAPQPLSIPKQTVFTVIVADKPFRMSWETLCSDGPTNFFVDYFTRNPRSRTVRIDRDPGTFEIILHFLRGYQIRPTDEYQNQNLLNDARYYGFKRLTRLLRQTLFLNVGGRVFRLSNELLARDGPANFFTGPLIHHLFFSHMDQAEAPPYMIDRNPDTFAEIISHLQGYSIQIRDEVHRANLLKDAQYYSLRRLKDKLMTARKTVDGFGETGTDELLLWLKDVRFAHVLLSQSQEQNIPTPLQFTGNDDWRGLYQIRYKREGKPHTLLVQLSEFYLYYPHSGTHRQCRMELCETEKQKLETIAKTAKLNGGISELACMNDDCAIKIDDQAVTTQELFDSQKEHKLCILRAIAAVLAIGNQLSLCMLRFEAISSRLQLNLKREFLP